MESDYELLCRTWDPWSFIPNNYNLGVALTRDQVALGRGDKAALLWENAGGQTRALTYGQLDALTSRLASSLRGLGVREGARVFLRLPNSSSHPEVCAPRPRRADMTRLFSRRILSRLCQCSLGVSLGWFASSASAQEVQWHAVAPVTPAVKAIQERKGSRRTYAPWCGSTSRSSLSRTVGGNKAIAAAAAASVSINCCTATRHSSTGARQCVRLWSIWKRWPCPLVP